LLIIIETGKIISVDIEMDEFPDVLQKGFVRHSRHALTTKCLHVIIVPGG
jgi:hypothetical protein